MPNLDRLKNLSSAKTTGGKKPALNDFAQIVKELQAIAMAQQTSQEAIVKSIDQLSKVTLLASEEGVDISKIVEAINGLKDKLVEKNTMKFPSDYEIHFERDRNLLMKSGIRLKSVPSKLN